MVWRKQESAVNHKLGCLIGISRMSCCCCCCAIIVRRKNRGMNLDAVRRWGLYVINVSHMVELNSDLENNA